MVFEKIANMIAEQLGIDASEITMETNIMTDLNADSLDAVEVLNQIEEEFDIEIPDDLTEEFNIVANLVDFVEKAIQ